MRGIKIEREREAHRIATAAAMGRKYFYDLAIVGRARHGSSHSRHRGIAKSRHCTGHTMVAHIDAPQYTVLLTSPTPLSCAVHTHAQSGQGNAHGRATGERGRELVSSVVGAATGLVWRQAQTGHSHCLSACTHVRDLFCPADTQLCVVCKQILQCWWSTPPPRSRIQCPSTKDVTSPVAQ